MPIHDDPLTSLAFALHRGPGQFALLLGSGVSRSSGVPTGWGVTLDLVRGLPGAPEGADDDALAAWYQAEHGREPSYSDLVEGLARSQPERRNLLRPYFEPTDEEREQGLKAPTPAHRAIAKMVALGAVRVVVTTNFDRLLEQALQDEGIVPDVVEHETRIGGTMPYAHSRCLILKLHGDYLDTRLRNTEDELAAYPDLLREYLMRLLDDHGLVIAGWSGDYDAALVEAILSTPSRRFGLYWMHKGPIGTAGQRVLAERRGVAVEVDSADAAFQGVLQRVEALQEMDRPRPLDVAMLAATAKRLMARPEGRIQLHDLVHEEIQVARRPFTDRAFELNVNLTSDEVFGEYKGRVARYEAASERLLTLAAVLAYHGGPEHARSVVRMLDRLSDPPEVPIRNLWTEMRFYPVFLLLYVAGTAAVAAGRLDNAATLLREATVKDRYERKRRPMVVALRGFEILGERQPQLLHTDDPNKIPNRFAPVDDHLAEVIPRFLREVHVEPSDADNAFAKFHYMLQLAYVDFESDGENIKDWAPPGRYYKHGLRSGGWASTPQAGLEAEMLAAPQDNAMLRAGFFGEKPDRFVEIDKALREFLVRAGERAF